MGEYIEKLYDKNEKPKMCDLQIEDVREVDDDKGVSRCTV